LLFTKVKFAPEEDVWLQPLALDNNVTVAGFSPQFPHAHCNANYTVCQITTGEAEINAASTITAMYLSPLFNLTTTYFLIAGIGGVNPYQGTTGTAAFARFAVQVALQYEIDAREIPANWSTGYFALGTLQPGQYPQHIYGTEVFELNVNLRDKAMSLASNISLNDTETAAAYRAKYDYAPAGDSACSDVYYSGHFLGEAFGNFTDLMTNGSGVYTTTAQVLFRAAFIDLTLYQEDNATLEAMVRAALLGIIDFARIVLLRTGSDFDRPPPGVDPVYHLREAPQGGFGLAIQNIFLAGRPFVDDVVENWSTYEPGVPASNYVGDILGSLSYLYGLPDFGPGVESDILGR